MSSSNNDNKNNSNKTSPLLKIEFDDGQRIIHAKAKQNINETTTTTTTTYSNEYYEIESISNQITNTLKLSSNSPDDDDDENSNNKIIKIALQFPVHTIYKDSYRISNILSSKLEEKHDDLLFLMFTVGDDNFDSSCCDNFISAQHLDADILIHFGHACFCSYGTSGSTSTTSITTTSKENVNNSVIMPVIYAGKSEFNVSSLQLQVKDSTMIVEEETAMKDDGNIINNNKLLIFYESVYYHMLDVVKESLLNFFHEESMTFAQLCPYYNNNDETTNQSQLLSIGSFRVNIPSDATLSNYKILYISSTSFDDSHSYTHVRNISPELLTVLLSTSSGPNASQQCYIYHPSSNNAIDDINHPVLREQPLRPINTFLSRRFYQIEKSRFAQIIGILIHSYHLPNLYTHVTQLASSINQSNNKTAYIIVVGKMTVAKLANFAEVDAFIIVACPETTISCLLQASEEEFHVPIITPYEWTFISNVKDYVWDGSYSLDLDSFSKRVGIQEKNITIPHEEDTDDDEPYYSLISGKYESSNNSCACNNRLTTTSDTQTIMEYHKFDANEFLKLREFRGALPNVDDHSVQPAIEGQRGIASDYTTTTCCKD